MTDEGTGLSWYNVDLTIDVPDDAEADTRRLGDLSVTLDMPVEVHIQTVERSIISYLVKPATDFFHRSLREE